MIIAIILMSSRVILRQFIYIMNMNKTNEINKIYFILRSEINAYKKQIKVI